MNFIAKYILVPFVLLLPLNLLAQQSKIKFRDRLGDSTILVNTAAKPVKVKGPKALTSEFSGGIKINSDGYGFFLNKGWLKGGDDFGSENRDKLFNVRVLEFELNERKDSKEKLSSAGTPGIGGLGSGSYILGKINKVYVAKLGYGNRKLIAGKPEPGTFSLHWVYTGGLSMAFLKPYYLQIYGEGDQKYSDSNSANFINPSLIAGRASFFKGFNEIKMVPGFYVKTALHLDFSNKRKTLWAMDVGVNAELYTKKIQEMVWTDPKSFFLNCFVALSFGKLH
jgi:hypothetical protein